MSRRVRIRHPGYHGQNTLFTLPAREGQQRDHAHYPTVIAACSIITDNESSIWLSHSSASSDSSPDVNIDDLLPTGDYFLHVRRRDALNNAPYPIVPSFRTWEFPHNALPQLWQNASHYVTDVAQSPTLDLSLEGGESCRITGNRLACEDAHIIPSSEKLWFASNEMDDYGQTSGRSGETVADTCVNKMRLQAQAQAHRIWNNLQLSIVPRRSITGSEEVAWYTQMMNQDNELERDWHYKKLQPLLGRACEFLYARFAYGIFLRLHGFLQGGQPRWLAIHLPDGTKTVQMYGMADCREFTTGQGKGRSASPTKRARRATEGPADSSMATCCHDREMCAHCLERSGLAGRSATSESEDSAVSGMAVVRGIGREVSKLSKQNPSGWNANAYDDDVDCERGRKRFRI